MISKSSRELSLAVVNEYDSLSRQELEVRLKALENEVKDLKALQINPKHQSVTVPPAYKVIFDQAQEIVASYFQDLNFNPSQGYIEIQDERYILVRAASLSCDFFQHLKTIYSDRDATTAFQTGQDFLFDIGHVLGIEDGRCFHEKMKLNNPLEKLSAGPVHFAYTGWGYVHILPNSNPVPNDSFFLEYHHPYSFEADAWLSQGLQAQDHVCIMNAAYSSGWCEASFGIPLTAVEIACRAKGDANCSFIMAPPHKINEYLDQQAIKRPNTSDENNIPLFFNRKASQEKIRASLKEKELMLQEIHHRVKNNLQIIIALMSLQSAGFKSPETLEAMLYTERRISSIALIHEMLYQSKDLSQIHYQDYLERMNHELIHTMLDQDFEMNLKILAEPIYFGIDTAIPLGLILNELSTNTYKHAFVGRKSGALEIEIKPQKPNSPQYVLNFKDDGIGFPGGFNLTNNQSLGLRLVQNLLFQLNGKMKRIATERGTHIQITFYAQHLKVNL